MPLQVDHDARRQEVVEIASDLIANEGVERATVRRVAEAAGCSTMIVSHYFANKHELLLFTYRAAAARAQGRLDTVLASDAADLQRCLEALLPLDPVRRRDWHIWIAFWGMAVSDSEFAQEHQKHIAHAIRVFTHVLRNRYGAKGLGSSSAELFEARRLFALVCGIAAQAIFAPRAFSPRRQRELIGAELRNIARISSGQ